MQSAVRNIFWFISLVLLGAVTSWLPHPPNMTALLAIAIFAGRVLPMPIALVTPILSVFVADLRNGFHDDMWVVYLTLMPLTMAGAFLPQLSRRLGSWLSWGVTGVAAATLFFVTTNLAVWWSSSIYPHTQEGLITCFLMAIPFFHNSVAGTFLYLFGLEGVHRVLLAAFPWLTTAACARATSSASPK